MPEIVQILIDRDDYEIDISKPNSKGYTPLYVAACFGHAKIIEILMKYQLFEDMINHVISYWNKDINF